MIECKVCGCKFNAVVEKHYVSRDLGKTGVATVFSNTEEKLYDTFDCPQCGCQVTVQERKREYKPYTPEDFEEEEEETDDEESEGE